MQLMPALARRYKVNNPFDPGRKYYGREPLSQRVAGSFCLSGENSGSL